MKKNEKVLKAFADFKGAIIETMREPLLILDREFRVIIANKSFYETFRVSREKTEGQSLFSLGDGQWDIPTIRKLLETVLPMKTAFDDYEVTKDFPGIGRKVMTISARTVQGQEREEGMILLVISDITFRKGTEVALRESRINLEASNADLEQFSHVASHDLQEPLRKIVAFAERLKEQAKGEAGEYCEKIYKSGIMMQRVIEDLLHFSRIGFQEETREATDLSRIVDDVVSDLELKIAETRTKIDVKKLPVIQANKSLMRHLFQNIISNSIKYCKKDEAPRLSIEGAVQGDTAEIRFSDNGIGFDETHLDKIFKPFQRLHSKHDYEGTGLGLAICQKIAHQHGGTISAKSEHGKGSTFIVTLPVSGKPGKNQPLV